MSRKLLLLMLLALLIGTLNLASRVEKVEASGTLYIRADGSIDPPTAHISTVDNVTYTFIDNISDENVVVLRSNIIVDGNGYTLLGTGNGNGFNCSGISNVTIQNTHIKTFSYGILLVYSSNSSISGNNITNNGYGIHLFSSSNNSIGGNNITVNNQAGIDIYSSNNNSISGNNMANNGYYGIEIFSSSSNNSVNGNNITVNTYYGIGFFNSSNNSISGNNITNNGYGIYLFSSDNRIYHNNFVDNTQQIDTYGSTGLWDDGSKGNYWSDYLTRYPNATPIGDTWNTPYVIDANNTDNYPLMVQYVIPEFPSLIIPPLFMIAILLTVIAYKRKHAKISRTPQKFFIVVRDSVL